LIPPLWKSPITYTSVDHWYTLTPTSRYWPKAFQGNTDWMGRLPLTSLDLQVSHLHLSVTLQMSVLMGGWLYWVFLLGKNGMATIDLHAEVQLISFQSKANFNNFYKRLILDLAFCNEPSPFWVSTLYEGRLDAPKPSPL
jgi:hypothetical protein